MIVTIYTFLRIVELLNIAEFHQQLADIHRDGKVNQ